MHPGSAVLAIAVLAVLAALLERLSRSVRIPDIVLFLLLGMVARPLLWQMLGIGPTSTPVRILLLLGAAVLVFEGGRSVDRAAVSEVYVGAALLATLGVLLSFLVVALAAHLAFSLPWGTAALAGAILAGTDPASVAPLLSEVQIIPRLKDLLLMESAANDATSAALAFSLQGAATAPIGFALRLLWQLMAGALSGALVGLGLHRVPSRGRGVRWRDTLLLPAALVAYGLASVAQASGFMASFIAGLGGTQHSGRAVQRIVRGVRAAVFIILGASLDPRLLISLMVPSLIVTLSLLLIGRPLTVLTLLLDRPRHWSFREIAFAAWVRETGVLPAALAGALAAGHVTGASDITAIVFMTVLTTLVVQAGTARRLALWLGILQPDEPQDLEFDS